MCIGSSVMFTLCFFGVSSLSPICVFAVLHLCILGNPGVKHSAIGSVKPKKIA